MKKISRTTYLIVITSLLQLAAHGQVNKVGPVGITVRDMNRSLDFYTGVLGFTLLSDTEYTGPEYEDLQGLFGIRIRVAQLQLGDELIELSDFLTPGGRSIPEDPKSNDLIFQHIAIVVSDMDKAYKHLRQHMVMHVSTAPQTIPASNETAAGIKAFYFQDPDYHNLELIFFPMGKGQAKWQNSKDRLFLGIDHTAIAVTNTDSSLYFYQQLLGIKRQGDSWNKGTEQAHLNFVENASLHITGLRAMEGPGIEFLEYLFPGPGKPYPADSKANDIWHWQTTLLVNNASELYIKLTKAGYHIVSRRLTRFRNESGKKFNGFIVRDGDGHAMLIRDSIN
jgi:catechol 2,3-dioxygenase-like lactoylglutathione lyase family enzyme